MSNLQYAQEMMYDVPDFTEEERQKIKDFKIPGEEELDFGQYVTPRLRGYGPKIREYYKNWSENIRWVEVSAGNRGTDHYRRNRQAL